MTGVTYVPVPAGVACNDNNVCTYDDHCDGAGWCTGTVVACTSDACVTRTCNGTPSCTVAYTLDSCDDGDACTAGDRCDGTGACVGAPVVSDACTAPTGSACVPGTPIAYSTGTTAFKYDAAGHLLACADAGIPSDPPIAAFQTSTSPRAGIPVHFTDLTTAPSGCIASWAWDFGDDTSSTEQNPFHTYASAGVQEVRLVVTSSLGDSTETAQALDVPANAPPAASFTYSPAAPAKHDVVTFTDTSTDDDGIVRREWWIGSTSSSAATVAVTICDDVLVTLTVYDHAGQYSSVSQAITVGDAEPRQVLVSAGGDAAQAVSQTCPGDTVRLAAGTYSGGLLLPGVNLVGAGAGATIISGYGANARAYVVTTEAPDGSTVQIQGVTISGGGVSGVEGGGVRVDGQGWTRLLDVEVRDNVGDGGIQVTPYSAGIEVRRANVHHNTNDAFNAPYGGGLGMACCGYVTITDSEFGHNAALYADGGGAGPSESAGVLFTGNYVHDNGAGLYGGGLIVNSFNPGDRVFNNRFTGNTAGYGAGAALWGHVLFAGNLVTGNMGSGVGAFGYVTVVSSTIADNAGPGLEGEAIVKNSIVTGNLPDVAGTLDAASYPNLISWDPACIFVGGGDYHLAPGSDALDAGDNSAVPPGLDLDLDGRARLADGSGVGTTVVDIGYSEAPSLPVCAGP